MKAARVECITPLGFDPRSCPLEIRCAARSNAWNASAEGAMTNLLNFVMLVCAIVGSMAFGVLTAYGIFRVGFALMRPRPKQAVTVKPATEVAV